MKVISFMNRYKPFINGYRLNRKALANASAFLFLYFNNFNYCII